MSPETLRLLGTYLLIGMAVALALSLLIFVVAIRQMRRIDIPPGAGYAETLRHTPFLVVVFVDLLDLALDFLAAPFAWVILDRLGLKALRGVATVEAILPLTQAVPTLTLSWLAVRLANVGVTARRDLP